MIASEEIALAAEFSAKARTVLEKFGRDKGYDIPTRTDYVRALRPLLNAVGADPRLTVIVFTLDETSYSRELAPLAGVYPALKLGPVHLLGLLPITASHKFCGTS